MEQKTKTAKGRNAKRKAGQKRKSAQRDGRQEMWSGPGPQGEGEKEKGGALGGKRILKEVLFGWRENSSEPTLLLLSGKRGRSDLGRA